MLMHVLQSPVKGANCLTLEKCKEAAVHQSKNIGADKIIRNMNTLHAGSKHPVHSNSIL